MSLCLSSKEASYQRSQITAESLGTVLSYQLLSGSVVEHINRLVVEPGLRLGPGAAEPFGGVQYYRCIFSIALSSVMGHSWIRAWTHTQLWHGHHFVAMVYSKRRFRSQEEGAMHRYQNILAALGGMPLDDAIANTEYALSKQLDVSGLEIRGKNGAVVLTLEEKYTIAKYVKEILGTRLDVLVNESDDDKWETGLAGMADETSIDRGQPLERLKGTVHQYDEPFEPVGVEGWEASEKELGGHATGDDIPIHTTPAGTRYVRILDLPPTAQDEFMRYLRGAAMPVVHGEPGPVAFESDWLDWRHHRRPDRMV